MPIPALAAAITGSSIDSFSNMIGNIAGELWGREDATTAYQRQNEMSDKLLHYQTTMSNSAHQREVADLKAAGLNPMLSAMGGGGASTPQGSTGSSPMAQSRGNILGEKSNSANKLADLDNAIVQNENLKKTGRQIDAQTDYINTQKDNEDARGYIDRLFKKWLEGEKVSAREQIVIPDKVKEKINSVPKLFMFDAAMQKKNSAKNGGDVW